MGELVDKNYWKKEIVSAHNESLSSAQNAAALFLDYCKAIADYKQECSESKSKTFSNDVKDWIGISSSYAGQLAKIGERYNLLAPYKRNLPISRAAVMEITKNADKHEDLLVNSLRNGKINLTTQGTEVSAMIREVTQKEKIKDSEIKNELKRHEEDSIPSEELMEDDDLELLSIDEDGNEIWGSKSNRSSEPKEVSYKEEKENTEDLIKRLNGVIQQLTYDQIEEVLDYAIDIKN